MNAEYSYDERHPNPYGLNKSLRRLFGTLPYFVALSAITVGGYLLMNKPTDEQSACQRLLESAHSNIDLVVGVDGANLRRTLPIGYVDTTNIAGKLAPGTRITKITNFPTPGYNPELDKDGEYYCVEINDGTFLSAATNFTRLR